MTLCVTGSASVRAPRPPQFHGSFGAPRAPTAKARSLRAARPSSARQVRTFRQPTDVPSRPASAGAQRSRPAKSGSLTTQRKGKLVSSLRKEELVNSLFLRLQCGGPTEDLQRLARLAQGGVRHAPEKLVALVQKEAEAILAELEEKSPAQAAKTVRVPSRFSRALSPRGSARKNNRLSTLVSSAHLRILEAVKAEEAAYSAAATATVTTAANADEGFRTVRVADTLPSASAHVVPPEPVVVNVCGRNIELQQFLMEKIMARGKSNNRNLRHMLLTHDQAKCGAITRQQFQAFLHSVQVFLAPDELTKVFEAYGTPDGLIDYTGLAAALIPNDYPPAPTGWISSIPDAMMRADREPAKATHLVGATQEQYNELVSPGRRRKSTKPPVPRQGSGRAPSRAQTARAGTRTAVPTAWTALSNTTSSKAGKVAAAREQFLQKRGGPDQLRRAFQFLTKHNGKIHKEELAETMLSMGMSMSKLEAVYGTCTLSRSKPHQAAAAIACVISARAHASLAALTRVHLLWACRIHARICRSD